VVGSGRLVLRGARSSQERRGNLTVIRTIRLLRSDLPDQRPLHQPGLFGRCKSDHHLDRLTAFGGLGISGSEKHAKRIRMALAVCAEATNANLVRAFCRDAERTAATFDGRRWLKTGDRGYIAGGNLHIIGRLNDVIKRAGQRYDAADVIAATRAVPTARGRVSAFGIFNKETGTEDMVVIAESDLLAGAEREQLPSRIRRAVFDRLGVQPDVVMLVKRGSVPRTTSGKTNSQGAKARFREGRFPD